MHMARTVLQGYGLGIAENHVNNRGRMFAIDLIREGLVRCLFLETEFQHSMQSLVYAVEANRTDDLDQVLTQCHGTHAPEHGAPVNLANVAAEAIRRRIPVWGIDVYASDYDEPWLKDRHEESAPVRDKEVVRLYTSVVSTDCEGDERGCLVLYGKRHFTGTHREWKNRQACLADFLHLDYVDMT
jgi:hypothetical protein